MSRRIVNLIVIICICILSSCEEELQVVSVTGIRVNPTSLTLEEGETGDLVATISPDNADDQTVTWTSKDGSIASVSNGIVTGIKVGSTTITVITNDGGFTATCSVTVIPATINITSISLSKTELALTEGESETIIATVKPDDATDKSVRWSSSDSNVATVDEGRISAVGEGTSTITAKAGDKSASCIVVVAKKVVAVKSVELNKTELTLFEGDSETLIATVKPDDATDKTITWDISSHNIASVDDGKVTAIKEGTAIIYALAGNTYASCLLTVNPVPSNDPIVFADERIKKHCVAAYDTNDDGEVSYREAAMATSVDGVFTSTLYTSFDEFQFFIGIKEIPDNWFKDCARLKSISFPEGLTSIGTNALNNCGALTEISLPKSIKAIKRNAFGQCPNLSIVHLKSIDTWLRLELEGNRPFNCSSANGVHLLVNGTSVTEVIVPIYISSVRDGMFCNCIDITRISFQGPLTSIGSDAFMNCRNLNTIEFLGDVKSASIAFKGCSSMQNVYVPNLDVWFRVCSSVPFWGDDVYNPFYNNLLEHHLFFSGKEVKEVVIPEDTTSIPNYAFCNCNMIQRILMEPTTPPVLKEYSFCGIVCPIYVWPACYSDFEKAFNDYNCYLDYFNTSATWLIRRNFGVEIGDPLYLEPQAVDLGLSVKWASFNLGSITQEDCGFAFYWGQVHLFDIDRSSRLQKYYRDYDPNDYYDDWTGGLGKLREIQPEDDAARVNLGEKWRLPSRAEMQELYNNCTITKISVNGVMGYCFTSNIKGYTDKSIFFPLRNALYKYGDFKGYYPSNGWALWSSGYYLSRDKHLTFPFAYMTNNMTLGFKVSWGGADANYMDIRDVQSVIRPVLNE